MSSLTLNNTAPSRTPSNLKFPHASSSPTTSARNSYASVSEGSNATSSARTSYSSIFDPPVRVASFSRTSDEFIPDSASVSTSGSESGDEEVDAADSKAQDASHESVIVKKQTPQSSQQGSERERPTKSHIRSGSKDGPSALRELENVKEIICVAFGAFDRYYISWEDDSGDFHQEHHKLPPTLHQWLFPPDGRSTRHIPTLQVSFGSNDEFFASDKDSKISYRDSISPGEKIPKLAPNLASVARDLVRRKAYTVSGPSPTKSREGQSSIQNIETRSERRKTYMDGDLGLGLRECSMQTKRAPEEFPQGTESWEVKHERKRSIFPVSECQLKRLSRRSTLIEERPEAVIDEAQTIHPTELTSIERKRSLSGSPTRMEMRQERAKQERRRSLLIHNLPVRATWPDTKTILRSKDWIQASNIKGKEDHRLRAKSSYVNAEIQTVAETTPCVQQHGMSIPRYELSPSQNMSIGAMSDFFRCQYRLGDALAFV